MYRTILSAIDKTSWDNAWPVESVSFFLHTESLGELDWVANRVRESAVDKQRSKSHLWYNAPTFSVTIYVVFDRRILKPSLHNSSSLSLSLYKITRNLSTCRQSCKPRKTSGGSTWRVWAVGQAIPARSASKQPPFRPKASLRFCKQFQLTSYTKVITVEMDVCCC